MRSYKQNQLLQQGFTLVELMVSIAIMLIVAAIILVQYQSFNSSVILKNLAYEVAISIREAQVLSVSVLGDSGDFSGIYGVHFPDGGGSSYSIFIDSNSNLQYEAGVDEIFETFTLNRDFQLANQICYEQTASGRVCTNTESNVYFQRPDFDAGIGIGAGQPPDTGVTSLEIFVEPTDGSAQRSVVITNTGQITVQ